jgi:hypothetical protein
MSGGFTTTAPDHLIRSQIYSKQLKDVLLADLQATGYVNWMQDFPDGDTFNIPSVGQMEVDNYVEDTAIKYRAMATGNFQFQVTEYLSSGTYITEKDKQDSFWAPLIISQFVPKQHRAIMERVEADILKLSHSQTISDPNTINGADHRFVASGSSGEITVKDFAKALYALKKANVPQTDLIAIVDPSVEYTLSTLTNLVNVQNNPKWEGIVADGIASGMKFLKNVYGFDVYTSQFLADAGSTSNGSETVSSVSVTNAKENLFFSATADVKPFVGAWRQMPKVDSKYNQDFQREEYVTTARYGVKLFRPENLVVSLSSTNVIS